MITPAERIRLNVRAIQRLYRLGYITREQRNTRVRLIVRKYL